MLLLTLANFGRVQEVECMLHSDLVKLVRGIIAVLEQQSIILVHDKYERVVLVGDVSISIVLDDSHGYEIAPVLWRIKNLTTKGMATDLVETKILVTTNTVKPVPSSRWNFCQCKRCMFSRVKKVKQLRFVFFS